MERESEPEIDDDVFKYTNSEMSQCISGFGLNLMDLVNAAVRLAESREELEDGGYGVPQIEWNVNELVHWCRHFNGELKQQKKVNDQLLAACEAAMSSLEALCPKGKSIGLLRSAIAAAKGGGA